MRFKLLIYCVIIYFGCFSASNGLSPWILPPTQSTGIRDTQNNFPLNNIQEEDPHETESQDEKEDQFNSHFFALQAHHSQLIAFQFYTSNFGLPSSIQIEVNTPPPKQHA